MQLHEQRYEEIKKECVNMLEHVHAVRYPLKAVDTLKGLGVILIPYSAVGDKEKEVASVSFSKDAFQLTRNDKHYIFFNNMLCVGRKRYTLFHEG